MSNPLLRPDDPRFRRKDLQQPDGTNPFSEGDGVLEAESDRAQQAQADRQQNVFAAPSNHGGRPFVPQYELTADHRGGLLLGLSSIGSVAAILSWLVVGDYVGLGWLFPLLGIVPAVTAIFLAADDLRMMRLGARDPAGRGLTLTALVISTVSVLILVVGVIALIYWGYSGLPKGM
jgi:hypothetical protein